MNDRLPAVEADPIQRLLTVREVAAWLNVSERWVYKEVGGGRFPSVRVGGLLRFRLTDVDAYIDGRWTPTSDRTLEPHARRRPTGRS